MKYMLLIYSTDDAYTPDERAECVAESVELCHELAAQGKYLGASPLHPVSTATSVKIRNGKPLMTDGPFAETTEALGGYFLIDVADLDEALAVAKRIPGARKGTVEVRPVVELDNLPQPPVRATASAAD
ncbi:MAG: YciI family protein [Pirellulales bacterium]